jgi:hypothetical protein
LLNTIKGLDDVAENSIMEIGILEQKMVRGGAGKRKHETINEPNYKQAKDLQTYCGFFRSIHVIEFGNFCLIRAVLLGLKRHEKKNNWYHLKKNNAKFEREIVQTARLLNLPDLKMGLDLGHVEILENYLKHVQIIVFGNGRRESPPVYWNKNKNDAALKIYIGHDPAANHFYLIGSVKAYFNTHYYCKQKI